MIEVLALASAVSAISGAISSSVKAGSDVSSLLPQFGKLAGLEADIQAAAAGKHKGPLGRLSSSEEEGFAIAQAKMKHKEAMNELRSVCMLYGPAGMWDMVVNEQAAARQRQQIQRDQEMRKRDMFFWYVSCAVGVVVFGLGLWGLYAGANYAADVVN